MTFFNLSSGEIILLVVLGVIILGPKNLPRYAAQLADWVRQLRDLAEGAKTQIREEMGPAFDDVDWRQLDPRQYDPRRIVRDALRDPAPDAPAAPAPAPAPAPASGNRLLRVHDPSVPTPFDPDAT